MRSGSERLKSWSLARLGFTSDQRLKMRSTATARGSKLSKGEARRRLYEVLSWERKMDEEREKLTSSAYWSALDSRERARLTSLFKEERSKTSTMISSLLDAYDPAAAAAATAAAAAAAAVVPTT